MIKKILSLFITITLIMGCLSMTGCAETSLESEKVKVVTTLFPQYDFVRQIAGDCAEVIMLLPPGVESHSFEPSSADIVTIDTCDLFIYTGPSMERWAEKIIVSLTKPVRALDVSKNIRLSKAGDKGHGEEEDVEVKKDDHLVDPHIWTSPKNASIIVDDITRALCQVDPPNANEYKKNAENFKIELAMLDEDFREVVDTGARKEIFFGGRNAFHYFLLEYGLDYEGAYDSCSTESEPSAKTIARLIDDMREKNIPVIYYEEISVPKVAESISQEVGARMLMLHSCHNVTREDFDAGVTYISLMRRNLENLKVGLN